MNIKSIASILLSVAHSAFIRYPISTQEAGDAPVTPLGVCIFSNVKERCELTEHEVTAAHGHSQPQRSSQCVDDLLERNKISDGEGMA
ncbi:hypothetical protein EVAR_79497_1 [Eumeta japonica]|uniref:Secreted protein n=1 Tax=Eumeta variegata TaxID=151549 RepID=A0A4C1UDY9_EUMVA|nr:hypothetical protein EVAR_79497_1 [Eumeta japonica]